MVTTAAPAPQVHDTFEESWPGIIEATERRFGRLDVIVANASVEIMCKAIEMSFGD